MPNESTLVSASARDDLLEGFSRGFPFVDVAWETVPAEPGVYVIYDLQEVVYVGMAGRDKNGSLRKRLRDHSSGQVVNMFAQYLFLARVQFQSSERIAHPRAAKHACRTYILERCSFRYRALASAGDARRLETNLKLALKPSLNGAEGAA